MKKTDSEEYDVFFSYSNADAALAKAVIVQFGEAGLRCFHPSQTARAGDDYRYILRDTVAASRAAVFLISKQAVESQYLFLEAGAAFARQIPIYSLTSDLTAKELPTFFRDYPSSKLWDGLPRLIASIRRASPKQSA